MHCLVFYLGESLSDVSAARATGFYGPSVVPQITYLTRGPIKSLLTARETCDVLYTKRFGLINFTGRVSAQEKIPNQKAFL